MGYDNKIWNNTEVQPYKPLQFTLNFIINRMRGQWGVLVE